MKPFLALGLASMLAAGAIVAMVDSADAQQFRNPECAKLYRMWLDLDRSKAFAMTRDGLTCGYTHGYPRIAVAQQRALRECRRRAHKRRCFIIDAR